MLDYNATSCDRELTKVENKLKTYNYTEPISSKVTFAYSISDLYDELLIAVKEIQDSDKEFKQKFINIINQDDITDQGKKELKNININEVTIVIENCIKILEQQFKYWLDNIKWLHEKFPEGKYQDITGLCKVAAIEGEDGIKEQDYSLNPGRYVGVVIEEDGLTEEEFKFEMTSLNEELTKLNIEAKELERKIADNLQLLVK
jgi:type I restriction enzyme M protein